MQIHLPQPKFSVHWQTKVTLWELWDSGGGFCSPQGGEVFWEGRIIPKWLTCYQWSQLQLCTPEVSTTAHMPRDSEGVMPTHVSGSRHIGVQPGCGPWRGLQSAQPFSATVQKPGNKPSKLGQTVDPERSCNWAPACYSHSLWTVLQHRDQDELLSVPLETL